MRKGSSHAAPKRRIETFHRTHANGAKKLSREAAPACAGKLSVFIKQNATPVTTTNLLLEDVGGERRRPHFSIYKHDWCKPLAVRLRRHQSAHALERYTQIASACGRELRTFSSEAEVSTRKASIQYSTRTKVQSLTELLRNTPQSHVVIRRKHHGKSANSLVAADHARRIAWKPQPSLIYFSSLPAISSPILPPANYPGPDA